MVVGEREIKFPHSDWRGMRKEDTERKEKSGGRRRRGGGMEIIGCVRGGRGNDRVFGDLVDYFGSCVSHISQHV